MRLLAYLCLIISMLIPGVVLAEDAIVASPDTTEKALDLSNEDNKPLEFKQDNPKVESSFWKSLVILLLIAGAYLGFLYFNKQKTGLEGVASSDEIKVLSRKTLSPNMVAYSVLIDGQKFMIVQDKQGHSVTPLPKGEQDKP
ncbi:MAG: hypothetical protein MI867_02475 [Pseudomonadales bacterium]|nr:hypothetical protein [Pseudomonadales bacterium]